MQLISPHFFNQQMIPKTYTCKGNNISPPLRITDVPAGATSLVLVVHDPDAPVGDYTHWLVWNIPPTTRKIAENSVPTGARQGLNDFGATGYGGPCPPSGTHRYIFELYALNTRLDLPSSTNRQRLLNEINEHILETTILTGLFSAT